MVSIQQVQVVMNLFLKTAVAVPASILLFKAFTILRNLEKPVQQLISDADLTIQQVTETVHNVDNTITELQEPVTELIDTGIKTAQNVDDVIETIQLSTIRQKIKRFIICGGKDK